MADKNYSDELQKYKEVLDKKKGDKQRLLGHRDSLMNKLKELGFKTVVEAETKLDKITTEIDVLSTDLKLKIEEFVKEFGGNLK